MRSNTVKPGANLFVSIKLTISRWRTVSINILQNFPTTPVKFIPLLIFFIISILAPLPAQSQSRAKITGRVTDAATGTPLYFANVFLAGTTRGDATDKDGRYVILNVPPGDYQLVVSMMGYEVQKTTIEISDAKERIVHFNLKPKILKGKPVTVTAKYPKEWKKNLKIFEKVFFGVKDFAKECKLLNSAVLDFEYDRASGQFQALADQPLRFMNEALGYEVTVLLDRFMVQLDEAKTSLFVIDGQRFKKGFLNFNGAVKFKELLPKNKQEKKLWESNRFVAYRGSRRHFLKALWQDRLRENGFKIRGARLINFRGKQVFSPIGEYKVKADTLLKPGPNPYQRTLSFSNYLKVEYEAEKDLIKYHTLMLNFEQQRTSEAKLSQQLRFSNPEYMMQQQAIIEQASAHQISWLKINNGQSIVIRANGTELPGQANLIVYGYWYWDSADEWLPTDYEPPKRESQ